MRMQLPLAPNRLILQGFVRESWPFSLLEAREALW